jgi:hypothetical protein
MGDRGSVLGWANGEVAAGGGGVVGGSTSGL